MSVWRARTGGVALSLRVTPNAGADRIEGAEALADGRQVLRVRVAAVPDKGRANAAVIALLAKALRVPRGAIAVAAGDTARLKTLHVDGETGALAARIDALAEPKGREISEKRRN